MAAIESCLPIVCVLSSQGAAMEAAHEMAHPAGNRR
jgi:hypothetical protein